MGESFYISLEGEEVPVNVRRNAQAKRLTLRVDKTSGDIKLTLPKYVGLRKAEKFVVSNEQWLIAERKTVEPHKIIGHGDQISFLGDHLTIEYTDQSPRSVSLDTDKLQVGGPYDMASVRLEKWLRAEAKKVLTERSHYHAETLGVSFKRVSIGDMKSRWGSCSSSGTLRYSWRLVMAPFEVLDYVAAHEVSHIIEMNHSEYFWAHVARCVPDHMIRRRWLKTEGNALFKVRF
ncbi:MAG: M48 family metallopeptidase [Kordiimonas sp.]